MNAPLHITQAADLQSMLLELGATHGKLTAVVRAATHIDEMSEEAFSDLFYLSAQALALVESADEQRDTAAGLAGGLRLRLESKPEAGDRLPAAVICQMFEALATRGNGLTPYRLSELASVLGAYAQRDPELKPAFDIWIAWMLLHLDITTGVSAGMKEKTGAFHVYIKSSPDGADVPIKTAKAKPMVAAEVARRALPEDIGGAT